MNLKKQLELYLRQSGMSASELARRSGVSRKTIQNWLAGQCPRDFNQVKAICNVIGCGLDELVYGNGFHKKLATPKQEDIWLGGVFEITVKKMK